MKRAGTIILLLILSAAPAITQDFDSLGDGLPSGVGDVPAERITPQSGLDSSQRLLLAISSSFYPVTPGDVYTLTFQAANVPITSLIIVESDYTVNFNIFGKINAEYMTFSQLKKEVEARVAEAYPRSLPSLIISSVGIFRTMVKGEVLQTYFFTSWGMSRLSDALINGFGPYSSLREIQLTSRYDVSSTYDLFKAQRLGQLDNDPYLRPGDTITVFRRGRQVDISGEVFRPGLYQLLATESLEDLIQVYGGGFTDRAQQARVRIDRISGETARTLYVDLSSGFLEAPGLHDNDTVIVNAKTAGLPIVFFEGAVISSDPMQVVPRRADEEAALTVTPIPYGRITYSFRQGETLSDALRNISDQISPLASLSEANIIRESEPVPTMPVNLEKLFYELDPAHDVVLMPYDRIVIPGKQFLVSVSGDVARPGSYAYVPNRKYPFYLNLAGGIDPGLNSRNIAITDASGNIRDTGKMIQPEDSIFLTPSQVTVTGSVQIPGIFPFTPNRRYGYYLNLAGGVDPGENSSNLSITDARGNLRNPAELIQPDDNIYLSSSQVIVTGAVRNPGAYPYVPGRTYRYFLNLAGGVDIGGTANNVEITSADGNYRDAANLIHPDDSIEVIFSQVTVTGAVSGPGSYPFVPGKTYRYYLNLAGGTGPIGTPENIIIAGTNGNIRAYGDSIEADDTIYLLANQVTVSGAVYDPGAFTFSPGRGYSFYLSLAGGIDPERNSNDSFFITDKDGIKRKTGEAIEPGDRIFVPINSFMYNFSTYFPVITAGISFITTIVSIIQLLNG